jgi:hypothetical protein
MTRAIVRAAGLAIAGAATIALPAVAANGAELSLYTVAGGSVAQYDANSDGSLSAKSPGAVNGGGANMVVSPDGRSVYVAPAELSTTTASAQAVDYNGCQPVPLPPHRKTCLAGSPSVPTAAVCM